MSDQERKYAELLVEMKATPYWGLMETLIQNGVSGMLQQLFVPYEKKPLYCDPTYAQIVAHRQGRIEGLSSLFQTMEKLVEDYRRSRVEKVLEEGQKEKGE